VVPGASAEPEQVERGGFGLAPLPVRRLQLTARRCDYLYDAQVAVPRGWQSMREDYGC
jgi:hypothetical protein